MKMPFILTKNWTPLRGQILGTYNFRVTYIIERIFNDVNLHPSSYRPKVPWYNLRDTMNLKKNFLIMFLSMI